MITCDVLAVGTFGAAVCDALNRVAIPSRNIPLDPTRFPTEVADALDGDVIVLAAGRPVPSLYPLVDSHAYATSTAWLTVVLERGTLRVGPTVAPGLSPCHDCYRRRAAQHSPAPDIDRALDTHYRTDPGEEPYGWLPGTPVLAAEAIRAVTNSLSSGASERYSLLRTRHLTTGVMTTSRVVGCHGCPRCGLHRPEHERSHRALQAEVTRALGWAA